MTKDDKSGKTNEPDEQNKRFAGLSHAVKTENKSASWGPLAAILVTLGVYFGSQILAGLAFAVYIGTRSLPEVEVTRLLEDSVIGQFTFVLLIGIFSLLLLRVYMRLRSISWRDIGLTKPSGSNIASALPAYGIYFAILLVVVSLVGVLVPEIDLEQKQQLGFDSVAGGALVFVFVSLVIVPAFVEEIMVRGFLYGGLVKRFHKISAAFIASLIFAAAHLQLGSGAPPLWVAAIDTFILSMVLIGLRERTGNLWAGIVVHMLKNSLAFASLFIFHLP